MSKDTRYSRQSFLGAKAEEVISRAVVSVIGLGGGGSHVVQQLVHVGFLHYALYDPQCVEDSNLNRMVGATESDADEASATPKVDVAIRVIRGLKPKAQIMRHQERWQESPNDLRACDLIVACVDGFQQREEIERCARRFLIPLIDIGMDVHAVEGQPPRMAGQVILSIPGGPCMKCLGFLNEQTLACEAAAYGAAGPRPQVVWPNGVLASAAVGIAVDLLTDWSRSMRQVVYLSYDGNQGTLQSHPHLPYLQATPCMHHRLDATGDPVITKL
jgi:molybdopterin-synthase adenylyltransferase